MKVPIFLQKWIVLNLFIGFSFLSGESFSQRFDERLMSEEEMLEILTEIQKEEKTRSVDFDDLHLIRSINPKKAMTIVIYMAADNNLHYFAWKNIKQMELIGSNNNINIIVQINTPGYLNATKRYLIKQGRRILVQDEASPNQKLNSGSPYTLIDCMTWAATHFPADEYALFIWNHGSGDMDPNSARTINPCDLFYRNPTNNLLELDRGTSYLSLLCQYGTQTLPSNGKRGVCFDDTFKSYISNRDLDFALYEIQTKVLGGQKLALIAFDACLMSMIGVASVVKKYAQFMVSSQEVVYGSGYRYDLAFEPFLRGTLTPKEFAQHIVISYEQSYQRLINDYTQSALDLSLCQIFEENIHNVANLLGQALAEQSGHNVSDLIRKCKSTQYCTCFDEPSYIDIGHFYANILQHLQHFNLKDKAKEYSIQIALKSALQQGINIISSFIIENRVGQKLNRAQGVSIYFPEYSISQNYLQSPFASSNNWSFLLTKYILG